MSRKVFPSMLFALSVVLLVWAALGFVEYFQAWGGGPGRFIFMLTEFTMYIVFSVYLLRSDAMRQRFGRAS